MSDEMGPVPRTRNVTCSVCGKRKRETELHEHMMRHAQMAHSSQPDHSIGIKATRPGAR